MAASGRRLRRALTPPARAVSDLNGRFRLTGLSRGRYGLVTALLKDRLGRKTRLRARTDHEGRFVIQGLPPGTYQLEFGHQQGVREEQLLDLRSDYHNLFVNLQRRPERPD